MTLSLGHALVFLLASLGMVAMVHTFRNLVALRLTPGRADAVFVGETAMFQMHLENTYRQPRRALALSFGKHENVSVDIPANAQATVAIPCPATKRGRLDPGRITLSTEYPLGLFHAWSYPFPKLSCLVYPRPIETPLPPPTSTLHSGQNYGDNGQEDFTGLRLRQPNDSSRHIAWKAVARDIDHRPLLIKQFDGGAAEELWFDLTQVPLDHTGSDNTLEAQLSIVTGWVLAAERLHIPYGLRLPGHRLKPGSRPRASRRLPGKTGFVWPRNSLRRPWRSIPAPCPGCWQSPQQRPHRMPATCRYGCHCCPAPSCYGESHWAIPMPRYQRAACWRWS